jgi:hypothetical protein
MWKLWTFEEEASELGIWEEKREIKKLHIDLIQTLEQTNKDTCYNEWEYIILL